MAFIAKNPFSQKVLTKVPFDSRAEITSKISKLHDYFLKTRNNPDSYKIEKLAKWESLL